MLRKSADFTANTLDEIAGGTGNPENKLHDCPDRISSNAKPCTRISTGEHAPGNH